MVIYIVLKRVWSEGWECLAPGFRTEGFFLTSLGI